MSWNYFRNTQQGLIRALFSYSRRFDFLVLTLLICWTNHWYWGSADWPQGDTAYYFISFYNFYSNFFYHGEVANWLPYGVYGVSAFFYWANMTPMAHVVGLVGSALRVEDVLWLFKVSVLFDQLVLLLGVYLLGREMFSNRIAVWWACLGLLWGAIPFRHVYWGFLIYYHLPLALFLFLRFFKTGKPHYVWLACICFLLCAIRNVVYFASLHALLSLPFLIAFAVRYPAAFRGFSERSLRHIVSFGLFLLLASACFYYLSHMLDFIAASVPGRDQTMKVMGLDSFLHSSPSLALVPFFRDLAGVFVHSDYPVHFGMLSLVFLLYGVLKSKNIFFWIFLAEALFLIFFSQGAGFFVAEWTYRLFPPMRYFRYYGYVACFIGFCLILASAFGLDRFISDWKESAGDVCRCSARHVFLWCAFFVLFLCLTCFFLYIRNGHYEKSWQNFFWISFALSSAACFLLGVLKNIAPTRGAAILWIFFALGMFTFQSRIYATWPNHWNWVKPAAFHVSDTPFFSERIQDENRLDERGKEGLEIVRALGIEQGIEVHNFLGYDTCLPLGWANFQPAGLRKLGSYLFGVDLPFYRRFLRLYVEGDFARFRRLAGCYEPKLKLFENAVLVKDEKEAEDLIQKKVDVDRLVLRGNGNDIAGEEFESGSILHSSARSLGDIHIRSFTFNTLKLKVSIHAPSGAWLYYADSYHTGWHAEVDGKEIPVYEANLAFKAVKVPSGEHIVAFRFRGGWTAVAHGCVMVGCLLFGFCVILKSMVLIFVSGQQRESL